MGFQGFNTGQRPDMNPNIAALRGPTAPQIMGGQLPTAIQALMAARTSPANLGMPQSPQVPGGSVPVIQPAPVMQKATPVVDFPNYGIANSTSSSPWVGAVQGLAQGVANHQIHQHFKQQQAYQQQQTQQANDIALLLAQREAARKNAMLSTLPPNLKAAYAVGGPEVQQKIEEQVATEEANQAYAQQQQQRKMAEAQAGAYGTGTGNEAVAEQFAGPQALRKQQEAYATNYGGGVGSAQATHEAAPTTLGDDIQKILSTGTAQDQVKAMTAMAVAGEFKQQFGVPMGALNSSQATPDMANWYKQRTGQDLTDSLSAINRQAELVKNQAGAQEAQVNAAAAPALMTQKIKIGDQNIVSNEQGITINNEKISDMPLERQLKVLEANSKILQQTQQGQIVKAKMAQDAGATWRAELMTKTKNAPLNGQGEVDQNAADYKNKFSQQEIDNNVAYAKIFMQTDPHFLAGLKAFAGKKPITDDIIKKALRLPNKGTLER